MSVFKKIKDVLFDIEEEEETSTPIINKANPVIDKNPIKEVKMPNETKERTSEVIEEPKKQNNFNFPMDFEDEIPTRRETIRSEVKNYNTTTKSLFDDDFDTPRRNRDEYIVREPERKKDAPRDYSKYLQPKREEKRKQFTPSPVISPVYGVLNQNYTKDDVIVKTDTGVKSPSLEEVRKKAYEKKRKMNEQKEEDEFEEPLKTLDEILINNPAVQEPTLEEDILPNEENDNNIEIIEHNNTDELSVQTEEQDEEDTLEKDLFNLIDSMYEEKDGEEEWH